MNRIKQKPRKDDRINFARSHPFEFALLNVARKSMFIDKNGKLSLARRFSLNKKEFGIWGKIARDKGLISLERSKNRFRCLVGESELYVIKKKLNNVEIEIQ